MSMGARRLGRRSKSVRGCCTGVAAAAPIEEVRQGGTTVAQRGIKQFGQIVLCRARQVVGIEVLSASALGRTQGDCSA